MRKTNKPTDAASSAWLMPDSIERVPIGDLVPCPRNARTHSDAQIEQLRASLREFGFVAPVLIDRDYNIIAGHGRVMAARAEGMTEVPCVLVEHLTDTQRRAYILADNRLAESAGWDMEMVTDEIVGLESAGFDVALIGFDDVSEIAFEDFDGDGDGGGSQVATGTRLRVVIGPLMFDLDDPDHSLYAAAKAADSALARDAIAHLLESGALQ